MIHKLIIVLLLSTSICFELQGRDYFVSTNGSDSNPGTIDSPCSTFLQALQRCLPGDTVQVRGGIYNQAFLWPVSGTPTSFITLKNYNGEVVIMDGNNRPEANVITITGKSFLQVKGVIVQNNYKLNAGGITINGTGQSISIINCTVRNIGWTNDPNATPDASKNAHAIWFQGNTSSGLQNMAVTACSVYNIVSGNSEAMTVTGNVNGILLDHDTVHDTRNIGIDIAGHYPGAVDAGVPDSLNQARNGTVSYCYVYNNRRPVAGGDPSGIYVDGGKNISVIGNKSFHNTNGLSVGCENATGNAVNILFLNNQVYDNDIVGISFGSGVGMPPVKYCSVINNTFFKNGLMHPNGIEIRLQNGDTNTVANNILIPDASGDLGIGVFGYTSSHLTVTNNLLFRYNGYQNDFYAFGSPAQFTPLNEIIADPQFTDTTLSTGNFSISGTSQAINAGTNVYATILDIDAAMHERVVNGTVDRGALESEDGGCPANFTIGDAQLMMGKFVASQNLLLQRSGNTTINQTVRWNSPLVTVRSPVRILVPVIVSPIGCN